MVEWMAGCTYHIVNAAMFCTSDVVGLSHGTAAFACASTTSKGGSRRCERFRSDVVKNSQHWPLANLQLHKFDRFLSRQLLPCMKLLRWKHTRPHFLKGPKTKVASGLKSTAKIQARFFQFQQRQELALKIWWCFWQRNSSKHSSPSSDQSESGRPKRKNAGLMTPM